MGDDDAVNDLEMIRAHLLGIRAQTDTVLAKLDALIERPREREQAPQPVPRTFGDTPKKEEAKHAR